MRTWPQSYLILHHYAKLLTLLPPWPTLSIVYSFLFSRKLFIKDKSTWLTVTRALCKISVIKLKEEHSLIHRAEQSHIEPRGCRTILGKANISTEVCTGVHGWNPLSSLCQDVPGENLDLPAQSSNADGTAVTQVRDFPSGRKKIARNITVNQNRSE